MDPNRARPGECSPSLNALQASGSSSLSRSTALSGWNLLINLSSRQLSEVHHGRRCYNSQPGEHRRSDFSTGDGAHGKEEVSEPPTQTSWGLVDNACLAR